MDFGQLEVNLWLLRFKVAKGDSGRAQNQIDYQGGLAQNHLNNLRNELVPNYQDLQNRFTTSANNANDMRNSIMGQYQDFANKGGTPSRNDFGAYGGYQNFANTGGFSPGDIQNIRARDIAPTRSIYAQGENEVNRQRALGGNSGANIAPTIAKLAREGSSAISDANVNANAGIAQMVQAGKLQGLGGMTGIDNAVMQGGLYGRGQNLGAIQGQAGLYSATPGEAGLYGNLAGNALNQQIQGQGLQNQLGLGTMQNQIQKSAIPGNFQQGLQNAGGLMGLIGKGVSSFLPFLGGGIGSQGLGNLGSPGDQGWWSFGNSGPSDPRFE